MLHGDSALQRGMFEVGEGWGDDVVGEKVTTRERRLMCVKRGWVCVFMCEWVTCGIQKKCSHVCGDGCVLCVHECVFMCTWGMSEMLTSCVHQSGIWGCPKYRAAVAARGSVAHSEKSRGTVTSSGDTCVYVHVWIYRYVSVCTYETRTCMCVYDSVTDACDCHQFRWYMFFHVHVWIHGCVSVCRYERRGCMYVYGSVAGAHDCHQFRWYMFSHVHVWMYWYVSACIYETCECMCAYGSVADAQDCHQFWWYMFACACVDVYVYVCMIECICVHVACVHEICVCVCVSMYTHDCADMYARMYACAYAYICAFMHACMHICSMHTCACTYVCMHVPCIHVCIVCLHVYVDMHGLWNVRLYGVTDRCRREGRHSHYCYPSTTQHTCDLYVYEDYIFTWMIYLCDLYIYTVWYTSWWYMYTTCQMPDEQAHTHIIVILPRHNTPVVYFFICLYVNIQLTRVQGHIEVFSTCVGSYICTVWNACWAHTFIV